jgi:hypothetical protein
MSINFKNDYCNQFNSKYEKFIDSDKSDVLSEISRKMNGILQKISHLNIEEEFDKIDNSIKVLESNNSIDPINDILNLKFLEANGREDLLESLTFIK